MLVVICFLASLFTLFLDQTSHAATTLPTKMNFQGRLTNSAGNILTNGTYNMRFRIWDAASGGTQQWTEDRLVSAGQGITVTNGQFSVQLGSVTSLPASVFASGSLYFEVELPTPATATGTSPAWTEGAMTPRNQIASSAYAYNAETLDGIDSDAFAKLGASNAFMGSVSIDASSSSAFQVMSGATNLFNVSSSASSVNIGQSDTTGALLVVDTKTSAGDPSGTDGAIYYNSSSAKFRCYQAGAWADCIPGTTLQDAYNNASGSATITTTSGTKNIAFKAGSGFDTTSLFDIQNASAVSLFVIDSTNSRVYIGNPTADGSGTVLVLDSKNTAGDPTGTNGAMYYNSSLGRFRCYEGSAWRNCTDGQTRSLKSADQIATDSSVTFQDVTNVGFAASASSTYYFEMKFFVNVTNLTADLKYTVTAPTGSTLSVMGVTTPGTASPVACNLVDPAGTVCPVSSVLAGRVVVQIEGVVTTAATPGDVQLEFAQNVATSGAGSPTALKNSFVEYEKIE